MLAYLYAGAGAVIAASVGFNFYQGSQIDALKAQQTVTEVELASCGGRLDKILEDIADDREIDNLTPADLRSVPDHWMRDTGEN